jgi:gamma-glutamylcysteine synthetase
MIGKTAAETAELGKDLNFEKVWAMFAESEREMKESTAETRREMKELIAESHRKMEASMEESHRKMEASMEENHRKTKESFDRAAKVVEELGKKVDRVCGNVGGLNRSLGELIETLIAARLWEKFPEHNLVRAYRRMPVYDEMHRARTEIDILLSDTNLVMAVEVKRELDDKRDVDDHLRRMEFIRAYPPAEVGNKQLLGAVAGGIVTPTIASYAYDAGFYVLELTGETVSLIPPPSGFKPGRW